MPRSASRGLVPFLMPARQRCRAEDVAGVLERLESSGLSVRGVRGTRGAERLAPASLASAAGPPWPRGDQLRRDQGDRGRGDRGGAALGPDRPCPRRLRGPHPATTVIPPRPAEVATLSLPPSVRLFVATQPVDGRNGADSLMVIVRDVFEQDPLSGHLFILFSKRCERVRWSTGIGTATRCGASAWRAGVFVQGSPPTDGSPRCRSKRRSLR
jgi:hypothetical protein